MREDNSPLLQSGVDLSSLFPGQVIKSPSAQGIPSFVGIQWAFKTFLYISQVFIALLVQQSGCVHGTLPTAAKQEKGSAEVRGNGTDLL